MTQKFRHRFGRPRWSNCYIFCVLLFLRGRIVRYTKIRGHYVGLTTNGTIVHFKSLTRNDRCKYWFKGRPHAFKRG